MLGDDLQVIDIEELEADVQILGSDDDEMENTLQTRYGDNSKRVSSDSGYSLATNLSDHGSHSGSDQFSLFNV